MSNFLLKYYFSNFTEKIVQIFFAKGLIFLMSKKGKLSVLSLTKMKILAKLSVLRLTKMLTSIFFYGRICVE